MLTVLTKAGDCQRTEWFWRLIGHELMDDVDNRGSPLEIRWWIRALQVRNEDVEGKVFLLENMSAEAEERPPCNLPDRCWYYTCGHL